VYNYSLLIIRLNTERKSISIINIPNFYLLFNIIIIRYPQKFSSLSTEKNNILIKKILNTKYRISVL